MAYDGERTGRGLVKRFFVRTLLGSVVSAIAVTGEAAAETRALTVLNVHTQERATVVFKRDGVYDQAGLTELNRLYRDWRRNESIKMDPQLFDLVWEVYRESGSSEPIHVVCGYRSPTTNGMLRSRSRGVAEFSQHMLGKATDFYLPDVPLDKLRAIGMKKQFGGVGFYPTSGSPFVHMDTGNVRAWPRMSREQLVRLFPDGKTAHLPADGNPLPRYAEAVAEANARKRGGATAVASAEPVSGGNPLAWLFGGGSSQQQAAAVPGDDEEESAPVARKPQELRQGPPLPGAKAVASLPPVAEEKTASFVAPLPPPKPVLAAAPAPTVQAAAPLPTTQAAGSLVALPMPQPSPRAAGSLMASAKAGDGVPPGWNQGPPGIAAAPPPGAAKPAVVALLPPVDVPVPGARPASFAGPAPKARPDASASDAIAALTGASSERLPAATLGYASASGGAARPVAADLAGLGGGTSQASRPAGGVVVASLPPQALPANVASDVSRGLALGATKPAPKADRVDPLARLVYPGGGMHETRLFDNTHTTRTAEFAVLRHPDQDNLPQLIAKPTLLIVSGFGPSSSTDLRADRFVGPAVLALAIVKTD